MGVTQFFSNKQHTYFFFLKMPEFKDMMASGKNGWTSWWAFNFWIAQAFHLMYFNGFAFWDTSLAETRAVMAFNIIGFLAFFMVSIAIYTSWGSIVTGAWFFGVGWAGWVNSLFAVFYVFMNKQEDEKEDDSLSSVLICVTFAFSFT